MSRMIKKNVSRYPTLRQFLRAFTRAVQEGTRLYFAPLMGAFRAIRRTGATRTMTGSKPLVFPRATRRPDTFFRVIPSPSDANNTSRKKGVKQLFGLG